MLSSFSLSLSLSVCLASTAILGSWSRGTHGHTFLSQTLEIVQLGPIYLSSVNCCWPSPAQ
jgi:hypothetical protein